MTAGLNSTGLTVSDTPLDPPKLADVDEEPTESQTLITGGVLTPGKGY